MKKRKDKTLREIYEEKGSFSVKKKKILPVVVFICLCCFVSYYFLQKDDISENTSNALDASTTEETIEGEETFEEENEEVSISLEDYYAWKGTSETSSDETENYWDYVGDSGSVVVYEREEDEDDSVFSERTQRLLQELEDSIGDYEYSFDSGTSYENLTNYEVVEFDMDSCINDCESMSTQYYNRCVSSYESYMQSAQDAYDDSLSSCIANLGRNDPVCRKNAQKLYDQYMSFVGASHDYDYCAEERDSIYDDCYESHCVNNYMNK